MSYSTVSHPTVSHPTVSHPTAPRSGKPDPVRSGAPALEASEPVSPKEATPPASILQEAAARPDSSLPRPTPRAKRKQLGFEGEALVAETLQAKGFEIVATNLRSRYGELDLVARRDGALWMVEVKTRLRSGALGVEVSRVQQARLTRMAYRFLATLPKPPESVIFVVAVVRIQQGQPVVELIEQAFDGAY